MHHRTLHVASVLFLSAILRFWSLGDIPAGLSLDEVNIGLWLGRILGDWTINPLLLRLPFASIGVFQVFSFYILMRKFKQGHTFAIIASAILAILPWHIQQSRVYSPELVLSTMLSTLFLFVPDPFFSQTKKIILTSILLGSSLFFISILSIPQNVINRVNQQRALVQSRYGLTTKFFSNKLVESYRYRQKILFENLDFGNYFFSGHPRERWGTEETPKLFFSILAVIALGLFKTDRKLMGVMILSVLAALLLPVIFVSQPGLNIFILLPAVICATEGIVVIWPKQKYIVLPLLLLLFLEAGTFLNQYTKGLTESQFSPRRPIYINLVRAIQLLAKPGEKVVVTERLGDPSPYLNFYNKNSLNSFEFRTFNIWEEVTYDKLFVDILPDDPSPKEPLYKKEGKWPQQIKVLAQFRDSPKRQTVVIYRYGN